MFEAEPEGDRYMENSRIETLRKNGMLDELTGIYNRQGVYRYIRELLNEHPETEFCLIYWNIRKFKVVNNLFGRKTGDKILIRLADTIKKEFGGECAVYGRLERDNFICCVPDEMISQGDWVRLGEITYHAEETEYRFFSCYGLYRISDRTLMVSSMVDKARVAMETVKNNYMTPYAWYDESMWGSIIEEQKLNSDFKQAVAERQFKVYYQPVCRAEDGVITGAEALVRWLHPEKGLISPGEFIPIFEKNGFISVLDRYVWEEVCRMLSERRKQGLKVVPVSINVSRVEFYNYYLCEEIRDMVRKYELPTELLKIEITETAYSENPIQVQEAVKKLHEYGFVVLMDDFGSGYSSLNILKDLPIDILKIDMKFLTDFDASYKSAVLLENIVRMAKWMKFRSVAEGVETKKEWDFLKSVECDLVQGYYFYKPMPEENFTKLLEEAEVKAAEVKKEELPEYEDIVFNAFKHGDTKESRLFYSMLGAMGLFEMTENDLEVVQVNKGYYEVVYNLTEDFLGDTKVLHKKVEEPERTILMNSCKKAVGTENMQQLQLHYKREDGSYVWLLVKIRYLGSRGMRSLFYFSIDNIDELKKAEQDKYLHVYSESLFKIFDKVYRLDYNDGMAEVLHTGKEDDMQPGEKYYFMDFFDRFAEDIENVSGKRAGEIIKNRALLDEELEKSKNGCFDISYQIIKENVEYNEISSLFFKVEPQPGQMEYLCCIKKGKTGSKSGNEVKMKTGK